MAEPDLVASAKAELDRLTLAFFDAVSFKEGGAPGYDRIHALFIERGLLIKNVGATLEISGIGEFIEPRQAMFSRGELTDFREEELSEVTQVFGNVAQRFSVYAKAGTMNGVAFAARAVVASRLSGSAASRAFSRRAPVSWRRSGPEAPRLLDRRETFV